MQADLPHTLYKRSKSKKGGEGTTPNEEKNTVASPEVIRLQEEANRRMAARKAAKERGETAYESTEELFRNHQ